MTNANSAIFRILIVISLELASGTALADARYLLIPVHDSELLPHPLYGEAPLVEKEARFAVQEKGGLKVFFRVTANERSGKTATGIMLLIKNSNPHTEVTVKPVLDLIDGSGLVQQIADIKKLISAARASSNSQPQQSSFFAYGNSQFVASAMGGYAIGSIINELASSSQRNTISKIAQMYERHWLKDEYRIPPSAMVDGYVTLNGMPRLPLKARITLGDQVFTFESVSTEAEAERNYSASRSN